MSYLENRDDILEYLQGLDVIAEVDYNGTGSTWIERYPDLFSANGRLDYAFAYNGNSYTLRIIANIVSERLFYSIYDYASNPLQMNNFLVEYPNNLLTTDEFVGCKLYFYENKVYIDTSGVDL